MKGMIKMSLKALYEDAIEKGFNKLDEMEVGSEEYVKTSEKLNEMSDRVIGIEKFESEEEQQRLTREIDTNLKVKQMKQEQIDRYIKHGLTAVSVLGGLALTFWGAKAAWQFEEKGTITSTAGRKFIDKLFFNFRK